MTFDEIMTYSPRNKTNYEQLVKVFDTVIPFVGAGLSAGIMPTWKAALRSMCNSISTEIEKKRLLDQINKDVFKAAASLEEYFGTFNFSNDMSKLFSENHIDNWDSRLLEMTVGQLTALFPNRPVITTNFDRVLEHAYNQSYKPFEYVLGPLSSQALITKAGQTNSHVLYKVHGDIGRDSIDFGSIIFTLEQYEEFYSSDSSLVKQLSEWMSGKTLLFVGCSLGDDYTIKLLQRIVNEEEYRNGLNHFAIINCEKDNIDQRSRELGQKHILPIIFPDGDYDSVRLVLKRLYEDTIYLSVFEQAAKLRKCT